MTGLLPRRVLPVLMYHRIGSAPSGDPALTVTAATFERHLDWIAARGFETLSLSDAHRELEAGRVPRQRVLLTFDDGFAETLETATPLLTRRSMRAAVFVPADLVGREARLAPSYDGSGVDDAVSGRIADSAELAEWLEAGNDVGSHSLTHADLSLLDEDGLAHEVNESKRVLEELLGRPVVDFCYPYAHHGPQARRAVRGAGFRAAYAGEPPIRDLWAVPRMMVYPDESEARFARKLSGYYYWISAWHRRLVSLPLPLLSRGRSAR